MTFVQNCRRLVLIFALSATIASAQDLSKPITYRTVAAPLHVALDQISKQAGFTLVASYDLADIPIILVINGATAKGTMDHIATAVGAEWQKQSRRQFLLVRTDAIKTRIMQKTASLREANIAKAMSRLGKQLDDDESPGERAEKTAQALASYLKLRDENKQGRSSDRGFRMRYPGHRALVALVEMISPRQIAMLGSGEKLVLSTSPSEFQQPLPEAARVVFDSFTDDQPRFAAAFAKEHPGPIGGQYGHMMEKRIATFKKPPAKLLLIIYGPQIFMGSPIVEFIAVDENGKALGDAQDQLTVDSFETTWAKAEQASGVEAKQKEIPLSPDSQVISDACVPVLQSPSDPPPLDPAAQQLLANPDVRDPLSFLVSDGFFALAAERKGNLVACPTDNLFNVNFQKAEDKSFKLPGFMQALEENEMTIATDGDWTVAAPFDPIDADKARSNRELLGNCFREGQKQGYISIETASKLALGEDPYRTADLPWSYSMFGDNYSPYARRDKGLLRFFNSLSPSQIGDLDSGSQLSIGLLSKDQWQLLHDFVYRTNRMQIVGLVDDEYEDLGDYLLQREITEVLPDGMPNDGTISMKASEKDVFFAGLVFSSGMAFSEESTVDQIAQQIAAKEASPKSDDATTVNWISRGHSRDISFEFDFSPHLKTKASLREVVPGNDRVPIDKLPDDLKKKLDAAVAAARAAIDKIPSDQPEPTATPPRKA